MAVAMQQDDGPFPHWDDPAWDHPVKLLDAIRLWSPALARRLDQVKWVSPDEIRVVAKQRRHQQLMYNDPASIRARQMQAMQRRDRDLDAERDTVSASELADDLADPGIPDLLRDDWARLVHDWDQWDETDRLIHAFQLAGRLIIEKTRPGQHYIHKFAPPAPRDDLSDDYQRVGDARHDGLRPYDFHLAHSMIKRIGGNWLPVRILGGIEAEGERMRVSRLAREDQDAAIAAAWAALRGGKMRDRQLFGFDEIANGLSRKAGSLEVDAAECDRVLNDLHDKTRRGEFEFGGESDVVIFANEPPYFMPLHPRPLPPGMFQIPIAPDMCMLRRGACHRYVENSSLDGAPRLLREWFPEVFEPGVNSSSHDEGKAAGANLRPEIAPRDKVPNKRQRAAYSGELELWMAEQKLSVLLRMDAAAVARRFKFHCDQHLPGVVPLLPQRLRSMENLIEQIISRRRARTKDHSPSTARSGQ
jgi:hypothetical protein